MAPPDDWTFRLAQQFLDAAVSCGATIERRFVTDGRIIEAPAKGCDSQLVAVVSEGFLRLDLRDPCAIITVADVRLVLDLCVPVPGDKQVYDPATESTSAQRTASVRWLIQRGLRAAVANGEFCGIRCDPADPMPPGVGGCSNVMPQPWTVTVREGGITRWETTWRFME